MLPRFRRVTPAGLEALFLLLTGGFVLLWLHGPGVILGVDSYFVLRPELAIHDALSAWTTTASAGMPNFAVQTLPFYALFFALIHLAGYRAAEIVILWGLIAAAGLGMRAILRACFDWRDSWLASVAVASVSALYVFNPFTTSFVWRYQTWMELTWALLPWLAALLVLALRRRIPVSRSAATGSVLLLLAGTAFPHILIPPAALVFGVLLFAFTATSENPKQTFRDGSLILGWWALSLAWWIVPSLVFLRDFMAAWAAQYRASPNQLLDYGSQYTSIGDVLRLTGLFQLRLSVAGRPLYPWFAPFDGPLGFVLFALPLLSAAGFINAVRAKRESGLNRTLPVAFGILWLVAAFLMKGGHAPLAAVNHALLNLPLGAAWQHPYDKFALPAVMSGCILAGAFLNDASAWHWRPLRFVMPAVLLAVVIAEGWPAYSGQVLAAQALPLPGGVAVIPDYYTRLNSVLAGVDGFTLQLPLRDNGETAFAWDRGAQTNNDPVIENFNGGRPVIRMRTGFPYADALIDTAKAAMDDEKSRAAVLSSLGFGSVVLHRDWNARYFPVKPDMASYERTFRSSAPGTPGGVVLTASTNASGLKLPLALLDESAFSVGFAVALHDVKREQTLFSTNNGLELRWVMPGYFAVYAPAGRNGSAVWAPAVPTSLQAGEKCNVVVSIRDGALDLSVDGVLLGHAAVSRTATAQSVFLGSENRFRHFSGTISDFWIEDGKGAITTFSPADDALKKSVSSFGWSMSGDGNIAAAVPTGGFTVSTGRGASGLKVPQARLGTDAFDVSMFVRLADAKREQVLFGSNTGLAVRWIRPGYLEMISAAGSRIYSPPLALRPNTTFRLGVTFARGIAQLSIDDVPVAGGPFHLNAPSDTVFVGSANRFRPFSGTVSDVEVSSGGDFFTLKSDSETDQLVKHFGWRVDRASSTSDAMTGRRIGKLDVFLTPCPANFAYTADAYAGGVQAVLARKATCAVRAAQVSAPLQAARCTGIKVEQIVRANVSGADVRTSGAGRCLLTFNTSFSPGWKLTSSGTGRVTAHGVVNGFANGFAVETRGPTVFSLRFERQGLVLRALLAGAIVVLGNLLIVLLAAGVFAARSWLGPAIEAAAE